jgi:hypothetical protein
MGSEGIVKRIGSGFKPVKALIRRLPLPLPLVLLFLLKSLSLSLLSMEISSLSDYGMRCFM